MRWTAAALLGITLAAAPGCAGCASRADVTNPTVGRPTTSPAAAGSCTALVVVAPVADGFRPPADPWLPGNRGITFATVPGQEVHAALGGEVVFAGRIAGQGYVTIRLPDRRRVTYSFLAAAQVQPGDVVSAGASIGVTGTIPFHLGYLEGDTYLDPSWLVQHACRQGHAELVPVPTS